MIKYWEVFNCHLKKTAFNLASTLPESLSNNFIIYLRHHADGTSSIDDCKVIPKI